MRNESQVQTAIEGLIRRFRPGIPRIRVRFTENGTTMVSKSEAGQEASLRLHRIFLEAPADLLAETVRAFFAPSDRRSYRQARARIKDYVAHKRGDILRPVPRKRVLPPRGRFFDLGEVLGRILGEFFPASAPVEIGWSHQIQRRLMGKWIENPAPLPNVVLINRLLDSPEVPEYYLDFLVFHELLHETFGVARCGGRWVHHSSEFRERERLFPHYSRAAEWERDNVDRLYRRYRMSRKRRS